MRNKDYMKKVYRNFSDFVSEASTREMEYFILDSKFTSAFDYRVRKIIESIKSQDKKDIELSIIYNTDGEIVLIDASIVGKYIGDNYKEHIERYYKVNSLNKVVKQIVNGNEKAKNDFTTLSYGIIYNSLQQIYKEIKYKKDTSLRILENYSISDYNNEDLPVVILCVLILEDICGYIGITENMLKNVIYEIVTKRFSQND